MILAFMCYIICSLLLPKPTMFSPTWYLYTIVSLLLPYLVLVSPIHVILSTGDLLKHTYLAVFDWAYWIFGFLDFWASLHNLVLCLYDILQISISLSMISIMLLLHVVITVVSDTFYWLLFDNELALPAAMAYASCSALGNYLWSLDTPHTYVPKSQRPWYHSRTTIATCVRMWNTTAITAVHKWETTAISGSPQTESNCYRSHRFSSHSNTD